MIWRLRHLTLTQREERRQEAGRLLQVGQLSHAAIGQQIGVSRAAVSTGAKQLRHSMADSGAGALGGGVGSGGQSAVCWLGAVLAYDS